MSYHVVPGSFAPRRGRGLGGICPTCGKNLGENGGETIKKAGIGIFNIIVFGILAYITYKVLSGDKTKKIKAGRRRVRALPIP
jgi:hypothetical protein